MPSRPVRQAHQRAEAGSVCQVPGCGEQIPAQHVMCWPHWKELPQRERRSLLDSAAASAAVQVAASLLGWWAHMAAGEEER
jgi:hypothetical protein